MNPKEKRLARRREALRQWRARNPDRVREHNRAQAVAHKAEIKAYKEQWSATHPRKKTDTVLAVARAKRWNRDHPWVIRALTAKRRAAKKQRTPLWLNQAHLAEIEGFYHFAKVMEQITGREYHVDHEVPLQGRIASGLHVPENMRAIPASENQRKSNRFAGEWV